MILFWEYFIFNTTNELNLTEYNITESDRTVNYCGGVLMLLLFIPSTILNPIVFCHYFNKKFTATTALFQLLAISDFITNFYFPLYYGYNMIKPNIALSPPITLLEDINICACCLTGCMSLVITSVLSGARYISVRRPFFKINKHSVLLYLFLYLVFELGVEITIIVSTMRGELIPVSKAVIACIAMNAVHCIAGTIASVLTVYHLNHLKLEFSNERSMSDNRKSCTTILLMNIASSVWIFLCGIRYLEEQVLGWINLNAMDFIMWFFLPTITSALNPILCEVPTQH